MGLDDRFITSFPQLDSGFLGYETHDEKGVRSNEMVAKSETRPPWSLPKWFSELTWISYSMSKRRYLLLVKRSHRSSSPSQTMLTLESRMVSIFWAHKVDKMDSAPYDTYLLALLRLCCCMLIVLAWGLTLSMVSGEEKTRNWRVMLHK